MDQVLVIQSCPIPCDPMDCSMPGLTVSHHLPVCPSSWPLSRWCHPAISSSDALWRPLLLLPWVFPSIRDLFSDLVGHIQWPKYWSFSFSISPSNEYVGLISLKIDWFDLLAVQRNFRSLLQHRSSKAYILWCSLHCLPPTKVLARSNGPSV